MAQRLRWPPDTILDTPLPRLLLALAPVGEPGPGARPDRDRRRQVAAGMRALLGRLKKGRRR